MSVQGGIRPRRRTDLESAYVEGLSMRSGLARHGAATDLLAQIDGILTTLTWALGRSLASPLGHTTLTTPADLDALDRECAVATNMLAGRIPMDNRGPSYVTAVRNTLLWAADKSDTPPL